MPNALEWLKTDDNVFVIGFEPHPDNFQACKDLLKTEGFEDRCYLVEAAISNVNNPEKSVFYGLNGPKTNNDPGTSSLNKPIGEFEDCIDEIYNVNVVSLKYILDHLEYNSVDYLKTDTQGSDLKVLKSLGEHIKKVLWIQSEYDASSQYRFANTGQQLDEFLSEVGFERYEPVLCYYTDDNGNQMYQIVDYKYKNSTYQ
jgi:FkbM family methyltransferase